MRALVTASMLLVAYLAAHDARAELAEEQVGPGKVTFKSGSTAVGIVTCVVPGEWVTVRYVDESERQFAWEDVASIHIRGRAPFLTGPLPKHPGSYSTSPPGLFVGPLKRLPRPHGMPADEEKKSDKPWAQTTSTSTDGFVLGGRLGVLAPVGWGGGTSAHAHFTKEAAGPSLEGMLGYRIEGLLTLYGAYTFASLGNRGRFDAVSGGARIHGDLGLSPLLDVAFGYRTITRTSVPREHSLPVRVGLGLQWANRGSRFEMVIDVSKPNRGEAFAGLSLGGAFDL